MTENKMKNRIVEELKKAKERGWPDYHGKGE